MNVDLKNHVPVAAVTRRQSTPANARGDALPDWQQPFTESSLEKPSAIKSAEVDPT